MERTAYLKTYDPELKRAWATFADPVMDNQGECLQYMGSSLENGCWQHCFRHRMNPTSGCRTYENVPAPDGWEPPPESSAYDSSAYRDLDEVPF